MPTTFTSSDTSRRVDHEEFMRGAVPPSTRGADNQDETSPSSPRRRAGPSNNPIPRSFAYGAPSDASSVIPPSSSRTLVNTLGRPNINSNTVNTSNPNSSGAPLKDTSVRIANAIAEASMAGPTQSQGGPSGTSYASSSTLLNASQNPLSSNSLRPPPSNPTRPRKGGKPVSAGSSSSIHAAEYDEDHSQRGKRGLSPVEELSAAARQKSPFFISLREANAAGSNYQSMSVLLAEQEQQQGHIEEPSTHSLDDTQIESRNYESESEIFTDLRQSALRKATKPRSRHKGPTGDDNKAYRPSSDAEESSEDDMSEGGRRRKKKRDTARHLLDGSLPMVSAEKRRKPKGAGRKSGASSRKVIDEANGSGASHSPSRNPSPRNQGDDDEPSLEYQDDRSIIDLTNEIPPPAPEEEAYNRSVDSASVASYSIGSAMGLSLYQFASYFGVAGRLLQMVVVAMFETLLARPISWFRNGSFPGLSRVVVILSAIAAIIAFQSFSSSSIGTSNPTRGGFFSSIFGRSPPRRPVFQPPPDLPDNWNQFTSQFTSMQAEIAALSDHIQRVDDAALAKSLQHQLTVMSRRADDADAKLHGLISEVHDAMSGISRRLDRQPSVTDGFHKVDVTLERMQEWIRRIETLAEATAPQLHELEKKVAALPILDVRTRPSKGRGPQDVTPALIEFFEQRFLRASKDGLALTDYAIYSGGGRIIPSLTSPTYELRTKRSWLASIAGFGETNGPQGRPPVTALVPDINVGNCWPFKGSTGTLGVYLSRQVYVSSITIDHVAKEVTYDVTPAPKRVHVWGVVDGADNVAKLATYRDELENRKGAGTLTHDELEEMETPLPSDLPRSLEFIQLASVEYNPSSPDNVQTFPVPDRIRQLGIDVGVVLFDVRSNWGHPDFTCLYRVRVHGAARDASQPPKISESLAP